MKHGLQRYRDKRDFTATPEPQGGRASRDALAFVVQKHAASHLHYDFRLELDGTLKSWAVPKGPSLDPHDKRMAVHVEDHPLDYAGFEGTIPKGHYGAGTVIVWDRGTWEPIGDAAAGYRAGKLKFRLHGDKLEGGWTLVRMHGRRNEKQDPWLLIKERDDAARPASEFSVVDEQPDSVLDKAAAKPRRAGTTAKKAATKARTKTKTKLPDRMEPPLATLAKAPPTGEGWLYEIKFDGYRLLARIDGDDVRLHTRNGHDWSDRLPGLVDAVRGLGIGSGWLDGEIVVHGADGAPDFNALQNAFDSKRTDRVEYFVFDLPFHAGEDLRALPLALRREQLAALLAAAPAGGPVRYSENFDSSAADLLAHACRMRLEGVIGKRADAGYVAGRSTSWIKLKCTRRQEFVIGGWTDPKGSRTGIGSLLLGIHDDSGQLRFAGGVGSGFDTTTLRELRRKLDAIPAGKMPFADAARDVGKGHWVEPGMVAEVSFGEWTPDGRIRHAVFHALREDKPADEITREREVAVKATRGKSRKDDAATVAGQRVSHPERVIDAASGATKLDLVNHYLRVADRMLPHLDDRPVSLVRAPSGVGGTLFFQRHAQQLKIPELKRLDPAISPDHEPMVEVDTLAALIGAAQHNVVEFHTWNATVKKPTQPDRIVFDLDPGDGVAWQQVQEGAELTRSLLEQLGLASGLKTSGGKGLHVVVPIAPKDDWETVKALSKAIVEHMAAVIPERFVAKSGPKNRVGRIFVDYLRNGFGATTVCAWSARARPGLGVSVPCSWDELGSLTGGDHWTIANVESRLEEHDDPWRGLVGKRQSIAKAKKAMTLE